MPRVRDLDGEHLGFWQERHLCSVTTIRRDGSAHVVPMGVVVDVDGAGQGWGVAWAIIEGTAEVRDDAESVAEAVRRYAERYRQPRENPERVALRITISSAIGNV